MSERQVKVGFFTLLGVFLRLGLTSFGGPVAHLGYFRHEFVEKRKWLSEQAYAELVALCQFMPGPASSQVGIGLGLQWGGIRGALACWLGFTLPSAVLMLLFALYSGQITQYLGSDWLHGLKVVAVAVVAQALWGMSRNLCPDRPRISIAVLSAVVLLIAPGVGAQMILIAIGGLAGWWLLGGASHHQQHDVLTVPLSKRAGGIFLLMFFLLLGLLPLLATSTSSPILELIDRFYRAGALVFGGGHVVLPLLQAEVVPTGMVSNDTFLAGYGAAQAVPGPLFTFAAFLGGASDGPVSGLVGASVALIAIFVPAFLLVFGALPFWSALSHFSAVQQALKGINAAVVGILLAAFYQPVWQSGILTALDFSLALLAFVMLMFWKVPPYLVVLFCAIAAGLGWH
ncbi:chromate efflux transporter [Lacimicrobium sp. SS2-24]|uniref:chromate efflux transporter n=1 Tax=Lacimicrobium sp. SS2-24 TaxID=2005569 RepID=UPI001AEFA535|nr:chromate efflux transporter [Lacimicrobium sp. SS2-24]